MIGRCEKHGRDLEVRERQFGKQEWFCRDCDKERAARFANFFRAKKLPGAASLTDEGE